MKIIFTEDKEFVVMCAIDKEENKPEILIGEIDTMKIYGWNNECEEVWRVLCNFNDVISNLSSILPLAPLELILEEVFKAGMKYSESKTK